ncbi:MAG: 4Fe-4S binding protein [Thermoprotei archaeon]
MPRITINYDKCNLCRLCIDYCPTRVFTIVDNKIVTYEDKCIECYACIPLCPRNAIEIEPDDP